MRITLILCFWGMLSAPQALCQESPSETATAKKETRAKASPIPVIEVPSPVSTTTPEISAKPVVIIDNTLTFQIKTVEMTELILRIFDEEGAEVAANKFRSGPGTSTHLLNVNTLANGTYSFKLIENNGAEINKELVIARNSSK